jgi:rubrerythrin
MGPVKPKLSARSGETTPEVATAHDHGQLDVEFAADLDDLIGQLAEDLGGQSKAGVAGQGLARELEHDPLEAVGEPGALGRRHGRSARDEGLDEIADWFETLAKAERSHANRFTKALETHKAAQ